MQARYRRNKTPVVARGACLLAPEDLAEAVRRTLGHATEERANAVRAVVHEGLQFGSAFAADLGIVARIALQVIGHALHEELLPFGRIVVRAERRVL